MQKWEYKKVTGLPGRMMERLNELGAEGWELVNVLGYTESSEKADNSAQTHNTEFVAYLKRPVQDAVPFAKPSFGTGAPRPTG